MNETITFYIYNNPAYIGQPQEFQVGFIDSDGILTDITSLCTVTILQPVGVEIVDTNTFVVNSAEQNITVYIQVEYLTYPPQYFSYCFVQQFALPTQQQLYNTFVNYLPKNVYNTDNDPDSPVYCDNQGLVAALYQIYQNTYISTPTPEGLGQVPSFTDLTTIIANFFPDSGNPAWEQYLVGTNSLYLQQSTNYPALLTLLYQTNVNNNTNPYFAALNISKYIYYRLGILKYVYIGEDIFDIEGAFILNLNELSKCVFVGDVPNTSPVQIHIYIVNGNVSPVIPDAFRLELETFIRRITRIGMFVTVSYDQTFSSLGLAPIGDTYWKDPRQLNSYCIQYNPGILAEALGYTAQGSTIIIIGFTVTLSPPAPGNAMTLGTTYNVIITPMFSVPTTLPQDILYYTEFFSSDYSVVDTSFSGGFTPTESFYAASVGSATMNIYLGTIMQSITYTVS